MKVQVFLDFICIFSMIVLTVDGNILNDILFNKPEGNLHNNKGTNEEPSPLVNKLISLGIKTVENTIFKNPLSKDDIKKHPENDSSDNLPPKKKKHHLFDSDLFISGVIDKSIDKSLESFSNIAKLFIRSAHLDPIKLKGFNLSFGEQPDVRIIFNNISFSGLSSFDFTDTHLSIKEKDVYFDFILIFPKLQFASNYGFEFRNHGPLGRMSVNWSNFTLYALLKVETENLDIEIIDLKFNDNTIGNIQSETQLKFTQGSPYTDNIANAFSINLIKALKQYVVPPFQHGLMTFLNKFISSINILDILTGKHHEENHKE